MPVKKLFFTAVTIVAVASAISAFKAPRYQVKSKE
jgi:hypothetical protein